MSAKMATPGLLKIKLFWNKGYDVIVYVHDVTNKILSRDSNCVVDVVVWPKFGNSSISIREVIIISILQGFDQRIHFFWGVVLVQIQQFGTGTRYELDIFRQCGKKVKTKSQKVLWVSSYVCRSYRGKTCRGLFCLSAPPPPTSWIGLIYLFFYEFAMIFVNTIMLISFCF